MTRRIRPTPLPLPGAGDTWKRWSFLIDSAREDVVNARLLEADADARAILAELSGPEPTLDQRWGVWAAEPPAPVVLAEPDGTDRARLTGRKMWCSGANSCTHALVTARTDDRRRLYAVDLSADGVRAVPDSWHAVGMADSDSAAVDFLDAPAIAVGAPGDYLRRPGFWHGAIGVAACWQGGAEAVADTLRATTSENPHVLAHLGAVDAALYASAVVLQASAEETDRSPNDAAAAQIRALRVRAVVERAATETLDRVGRALGAAPLCLDGEHAQLVADLTVYLRQSHAEKDLAVLGALVSGQRS